MKIWTRFPPRAGMGRRILALTYEVPLVCAVAILAVATFPGASTTTRNPIAGSLILQLYIIVWIGIYFIACWRLGARTLPSQTWKLHLESSQGQDLQLSQAACRYVIACLSTLFAGVGFAWAVIDPDGQFFHDRAIGVRLASSAR